MYDHTVHNNVSLQTFQGLVAIPELGVYKPYLYLSDFWMLEKDYVPLNGSLEGETFNLMLSYSTISLVVWNMQEQLQKQLTETQRDTFMVKRLLADTNPYFLAFSGAFILAHIFFSLLAFKNDIQFWRHNQSMEGLSARSTCVSFVCQLITTLYLLDSAETSRVLLFTIALELCLAFWKLGKAINVSLKPQFPFLSLTGKEGYDKSDTAKYDEEAIKYMIYLLAPLFLSYAVYSALYEKHRGWYSYFIGTAAGGVYTFGFVMMTPQLYINYKLQSVDHLPWRALTYKAMNTFVDDISAFLIDMPMLHRLSCFRDDVIFIAYIYQRWKYKVDKSRPSIWVEAPTVADINAVSELNIAGGGSTAGEPGTAGELNSAFKPSSVNTVGEQGTAGESDATVEPEE